MRVLLFLLLVSSARADSSIPVANDFDLVERGCALMHGYKFSRVLLQALGAREINNFKLGWHGALSRSRFVRVVAYGAYDDQAVSKVITFVLPPHARLSQKEVKLFQRSSCGVHYEPPGRSDDPDWPGELRVVLP